MRDQQHVRSNIWIFPKHVGGADQFLSRYLRRRQRPAANRCEVSGSRLLCPSLHRSPNGTPSRGHCEPRTPIGLACCRPPCLLRTGPVEHCQMVIQWKDRRKVPSCSFSLVMPSASDRGLGFPLPCSANVIRVPGNWGNKVSGSYSAALVQAC